MNELTPKPQDTPLAMEAGSLARELAGARNKLVDYYRTQYRLSGPEALAKTDELTSTEDSHRILAIPPASTTWSDLDQLAAAAPELAGQRWEAIKDEARAELVCGHRAAAAVESAEFSCWKRAQFLALRDDLAREWRPHNGIERTLIDTMAQALTLQSFWMQRMVALDSLEWPDPPSKELQKWLPPRLDASQAIDQAAGMVDRFNRMFMRALRQLRDLRRYTVVIQNAEQVNVGQQQVNVAGRRGDGEVHPE